MRSEIRRIQLETGITAVLVTHDQVEAMSMCDRIAIMDAGEIIQVATPSEMYSNPSTEFVASFLGNPPIAFLRGTADRREFFAAGGKVKLPLPSSIPPLQGGTRLTLGIRPENFGPSGDIPVRGRVSFVETQGRENLYDVMLSDGSILRSIQPAGGSTSVGDEVEWFLKGERILAFGEDGARL